MKDIKTKLGDKIRQMRMQKIIGEKAINKLEQM
jgi:hypothetical protein